MSSSSLAQGYAQDGYIYSPTYGQNYATGWNDSIFLSTSPTLGGTETLLAVVPRTSLAAGASYNTTKNVTIPVTATAGPFYLIIRAGDPAGVVESNLADDIVAIPITLNPKSVDLTILSADGPATAQVGSTVRVDWTTKNAGTADANATWYDSVYLSDDPFFNFGDVRLVARSVGEHAPMLASASYTLSENVAIPGTLTGARYLLFIADDGSTQAESDETNNVLAVPITITGPAVDLVVTRVTAPTSASLTRRST